MNALEQFELMEVEEMQEQQDTFKIDSMESLNWVFRKLNAYKAKEKEIKQLANKERNRIDSWEKGQLSTIENSISFFEGHVQTYHAKQLEADKDAKTISTPYGKSKTRSYQEVVDKQSEEVLLQYVIENEMDDCIKNSIKWDELKKKLKIVEISGTKTVVDENGQFVPGVYVKPASVSYSVEV